MKFNNKKGFTLMELLIVISIVMVVGSIITGILLSSLRGSSKAKALDNVRKNGNYAIEQISKSIKYAKSVEGVSIDNETYKSTCLPEDSASGYTVSETLAADKTNSDNNKKGLFSFDLKKMITFLFGTKDAQKGQVAGVQTPNQEFIASNSDLTSYYYRTSRPADTAGTCSSVPGGNLTAGQGFTSPNYFSWRTHLPIDTSAIPDDATIDSARLQITVTSTNFALSSYIRVKNAAPSCATWNPSPATNLIINNYPSSWITVGKVNIDLTSSGLSAISKTGITNLMISTNNEETDSTYTTNEYFVFKSADNPTVLDRPRLIITYTTPNPAPTVTTGSVTETVDSAIVQGSANQAGTAWFRYSHINGPCNSSFGRQTETVAYSGSGSFSQVLSGLYSGTPYYVCAVVQNSDGNIGYASNVVSFSTSPAPVVPNTPYPEVDSTQYNFVKVKGFDNGETIFSCLDEVNKANNLWSIPNTSDTKTGIASNSSMLIDTSSIKVDECRITCQQVSLSSPPTVSIKFTLSNKGGNGLSENSAKIPFETTITARNY